MTTVCRSRHSDKNLLKELNIKKKSIDRTWSVTYEMAKKGEINREMLVSSIDMSNKIDKAIIDREKQTDWQVRVTRI